LASVQQDAILKCGHLEHYDIGTCEMRARAEGTGSISRNAAGECVSNLCQLCGSAECMHHVVALQEARCAHEQIIQSGCESDIIVENRLVDMYAKCGSMEDA
jgi:hypothetical protein